MVTDDPGLYMDVFGTSATLAGAALVAMVDTAAELVIDDVVTQSPVAMLRSADAPAAAAGQSFVADGVAYTVRQVLREPPDGAFVRLVLARS